MLSDVQQWSEASYIGMGLHDSYDIPKSGRTASRMCHDTRNKLFLLENTTSAVVVVVAMMMIIVITIIIVICHQVTPINDLFRPHDYIRQVVSLTVVRVFTFR
jgi:hypothetical protein